MKRIKIMGLCLVAVFAMSAVAASSSSALTYKTCKKTLKNPVTKKYEGKYSVKNCATEASPAEQAEGKKNKYEKGAWNEGKEASPKFKNTNGASTLFSYVKGFGIVGAVTCTKAKGEGHITGPASANTTVVFEKCTSSGESCHSAGESAGKIKTALLNVSLGETGGKVIARVGEAGQPSASFECGPEKIITTGTADGVNTGNVNTIVKEATQTFSTNAGGEQENTVGGDVLLTEVVGVGNFESGESTTAKIKGEEMEIEAP